ncbi:MULTISPECIES: DUF2637 domain-containing protein [unclassified Streptomyces]|uniref:DUF2637 domain-containing protein n=1 Tax=unclassified Streptomyces TaxID=2593676 RepID=UPI002DD7FF71|nr:MULTISPECIES: DUF2637 domain-containing protein [unclassified Streptomyces]WSC37540.1 DUF2637 domain-containing protein [Streptomyces sp. NBC_01763]WSC55354.1 DUF2637 domain-containing protein [Streptomyces sp. NBC_01761]WSF86190.1 DUF2637 domain-containing protein [Streptomyces sp. NBC_01744]
MSRPTIRMDAVLVQAVIAGALSFAHLHDLAAAAGQTGWKAWAYPISVDLLLVAAWRRLRNGGASRLAWSWFLIALVASLGANVATAGFLDLANPPAWLRFGVAGWPALAFLGGTLLAHTLNEAKEREPNPPAPAAARIPAEPDPAPALATEDPPALPAPASPPVPAALVNHARKLATDHHARTGTPIDTDTLRARLGVPAPMAEAIAAQLT